MMVALKLIASVNRDLLAFSSCFDWLVTILNGPFHRKPTLAPIDCHHDFGAGVRILSDDAQQKPQAHMTGCKDAWIRIVDATTHQLFRTPTKGHDKPVTNLAVALSSTYLISNSWDDTANIWNSVTNALNAALQPKSSVCVTRLLLDTRRKNFSSCW